MTVQRYADRKYEVIEGNGKLRLQGSLLIVAGKLKENYIAKFRIKHV